MENEVFFNYFYRMFNEKMKNKYQEFYQKRIERIKNNSISISIEDLIEFYNNVLFEVCINYIQLANPKIDVIPNNIFEVIYQILDTINENEYKESFLTSLQFIYQDYLNNIGRGYPILMKSNDCTYNPRLEITVDSEDKLIQLESVNMNIIEEDILMTKLMEMEVNHKQGPLPKVLYRIRKDI